MIYKFKIPTFDNLLHFICKTHASSFYQRHYQFDFQSRTLEHGGCGVVQETLLKPSVCSKSFEVGILVNSEISNAFLRGTPKFSHRITVVLLTPSLLPRVSKLIFGVCFSRHFFKGDIIIIDFVAYYATIRNTNKLHFLLTPKKTKIFIVVI